MVPAEKCLAVYRGRPALVEALGEKIAIVLPGGEAVKVREKDIGVLHPGPLSRAALDALAGSLAPEQSGDVRGAWELLRGESTDLKGLAELVFGEWTAGSAWNAWLLLQDGLYFEGEAGAVLARDPEQVDSGEKKRAGKEKETREREEFLARLRAGTVSLPGDGRFLQDVEALALGQAPKSRTMKDAGRQESPEEAHRLLLETGVWDAWVNPWPSRCGCAVLSAREPVPPPPEEERRDLRGLRAWAIDSEHSADPDDAVSIAVEEGRTVIWVHVADPASSILPGSAADLEARGRGATLYLPEGPSRMLEEAALQKFALGLAETSPALSFRMVLDQAGEIEETEIFPSLVNVTRLTTRRADALLAAGEDAGLAALSAWAERNIRRRTASGAVMIEMPEIHIAADRQERQIAIEENRSGPSQVLVRECMLLAGEGAARWASRQQLPFPFISQELGDLPEQCPPGFAGAWRLRRSMRRRTLSVKPGLHGGLGLVQYSQVTSPLRRYTDLLAHQQIRAALGGGAWAGRAPLDQAEMTLALGAGDAAYQATVQAERSSRNHWIMLYLSQRPEARWDAVVLDRNGNRATLLIPALALETQAPVRGTAGPNDPVRLHCVSAKLWSAAPVFQADQGD